MAGKVTVVWCVIDFSDLSVRETGRWAHRLHFLKVTAHFNFSANYGMQNVKEQGPVALSLARIGQWTRLNLPDYL